MFQCENFNCFVRVIKCVNIHHYLQCLFYLLIHSQLCPQWCGHCCLPIISSLYNTIIKYEWWFDIIHYSLMMKNNTFISNITYIMRWGRKTLQKKNRNMVLIGSSSENKNKSHIQNVYFSRSLCNNKNQPC